MTKFNITAMAILYPLWALIMYGVNYIFLPAWNFQSGGFRMFVVFGVVLLIIFESLIHSKAMDKFGNQIAVYIKTFLYGGILLVLVIVIPLLQLFNSPITRADDYANMINVEEKTFNSDFPTIGEQEIPMIDRDTATRLGSRAIGSMEDLVSQFEPAEDYMQININNHPYRVTPMKYASLTRWLRNKDEGIKNYLQVDMVNGEVEVVELDEGMKYTDSERFGRNVKRHLRRTHPTTIFGDPSFEVDDEGNPYYIATTYEPAIFLNNQEPTGVITLDAVTGETQDYELEEVPSWIDRVYSADLALKQLKDNGAYKNGWLNTTIFGSKSGVTQPTEGYNYIPMNDDVYLYTGVTSINSDASNIGFYLVNMRTKETSFYPVNSADEYSAMGSAEGVVQEREYTSTFPLLLSLNEDPYFISSLKDNSGLVRLYALVDAQDYQKVIIDESIDGIISQLNGGEVKDVDDIEESESDEILESISGNTENINQTVVAGDTVYYFMIDGTIYKANINLNDSLPFLEEGDNVEGQINEENEFKTIILE